MKTKILWARYGDHDNYNQTTIEEVVDQLHELNIKEVFRANTGITDHNIYEGLNYISLYYGDTKAEFVQRITNTDINRINSLLKGKYHESKILVS